MGHEERRRTIGFANYRWCVLFAVVVASVAFAQQYPARPLRLIVPFAPGGGTDTLARAINTKLTEAFGRQVVIDNRPGAGANIGAEMAAKSAPDGYTLLMVSLSHAINASIYSKLNYDLIRDFAPVTLLAGTAHVLVVHPSLPARTVKELVALAKARPGQLDYASSGSGSTSHLAAALFGAMTGATMNHIPYKGGGPAVIALVGGEASVGFATTPSVIQHVRSGRLRGLAVTSLQRLPSAPDLPTVSESGVAGYEAVAWYALLVPAGTPREIVVRLHAETVRILGLADVRERLDAAGFEVMTSSPERCGTYMKSEVEKWAEVVKASGARVD
jgi:tripartite-type tricarboxylate transporter receptor subunit TctC